MEARILRWRDMSKNRTKGAEDFEAMKREVARQDAEKRAADRVEHLVMQIPMRFRGKEFDDYQVTTEEQSHVKQLAERYVETFADRIKEGTSIRFMGRPGTGKTLLSLIIYQALIRQGYTAKYEPSTEFLKSLLEIKFQSQSNFSRHLEILKQYQLLIIDEVTESVNKNGVLSEIEKQLLFRIINDRYENKLCTLVITNRDETDLIKCLGEPAVDRLSEGGIALGFNWCSYRQQ